VYLHAVHGFDLSRLIWIGHANRMDSKRKVSQDLTVTLDNKFQKKFFVSVMNMLLIYLFASMKLEKGH
jgi:hypothetical protein